MSNIRMIVSPDLQVAAYEITNQICSSRNIRAVVIAAQCAIDERWRKALAVFGNRCPVAVVRGFAREKDKAMQTDSRIIFITPGCVGRLLINSEIKTDVLVLDDLERLIAIREEFRNNISLFTHSVTQTIGITHRFNENHLRYIPRELRIMGLENMMQLSPGAFYERYYFRNYIKDEKGNTVCRFELKPGAIEAVQRFLEEICDLRMIDRAEAESIETSGHEDYIPLDYKEKSKYRFINRLREEKIHGSGIGHYNEEYL